MESCTSTRSTTTPTARRWRPNRKSDCPEELTSAGPQARYSNGLSDMELRGLLDEAALAGTEHLDPAFVDLWSQRDSNPCLHLERVRRSVSSLTERVVTCASVSASDLSCDR